jgi:hypothetical protein
MSQGAARSYSEEHTREIRLSRAIANGRTYQHDRKHEVTQHHRAKQPPGGRARLPLAVW